MTMITTAPGQRPVKSRRVKPSQVVRYGLPDSSPDTAQDGAPESADWVILNPSLDDPTVYPASDDVGRECVENEICLQLQPVLRRQFADRGIVAFVGSDAFIYWVKGDPTACVSPDVYVLPGIAQSIFPSEYPGSNDEQCWKTWIHHVVPNFALEVKAHPNPRKDELKAPARHDALGTKELVVFDPFVRRRRSHRKRFVVHRRDASGKLVIALATNEDRVYVQELDMFLVAEGYGNKAVLRLALGPNGETLVPFESELVDMNAARANVQEQRANVQERRANEEAQRANEAARRANEQERRANEAGRRANEEAQRANEEARRANEEARRANEEARLRQQETQQAKEARSIAENALRRACELEAELARLRAIVDKRPQRTSKSAKSRIDR
jgi:hypothetical protein